MPVDENSYKQNPHHGSLVRSPARSLAVGLSFFLAACSTSPVRVSSDTAVTTDKSPQAMQPLVPAVVTVGNINRGGNLSAGLRRFDKPEGFKNVTQPFAPSAMAFGQSGNMLHGISAKHSVFAASVYPHPFPHSFTFAQSLSRTGRYENEKSCSSSRPLGLPGLVEVNEPITDGALSLTGDERLLHGGGDPKRLHCSTQPPLLPEGYVAAQVECGLCRVDFSASEPTFDQRRTISIITPAAVSGSPPLTPLKGQKRNG